MQLKLDIANCSLYQTPIHIHIQYNENCVALQPHMCISPQRNVTISAIGCLHNDEIALFLPMRCIECEVQCNFWRKMSKVHMPIAHTAGTLLALHNDKFAFLSFTTTYKCNVVKSTKSEENCYVN